MAEANKSLEVTLQEVSKLNKDHLVEIKALPNPPRACVVILGGMVVLLTDKIKKMGGEIIMKNVEGQIGKKEEDFFSTAKKYNHIFDFLGTCSTMLRIYSIV